MTRNVRLTMDVYRKANSDVPALSIASGGFTVL